MKRSPMKRRRATPRRSDRVRDPGYLVAVRLMECCAWALPDAGRCAGVIEADHAGLRPAGRKCSDNETIPLCSRHHVDRHQFLGAFRGWDRARMRAWLDEQIANTQAVIARRTDSMEAA